ncbi:MAG TPA: hypothetical protein PK001_13100 [Dokdonella sp.]|nr:hypothetical protein [Dokdonella sp.]
MVRVSAERIQEIAMLRTRQILSVAGVVLLVAIDVAVAQSAGGSFRIRSHTIDGGGRAVGGAFTLSGTAGQMDAGDHLGGVFRLRGGFWPTSFDDTLFRDGFEP